MPLDDDAPDDAPEPPPLTPEERQQRGLLIHTPEAEARFRKVAGASLKKHGDLMVDDVLAEIEEEALHDPKFPVDEGALDAFFERVAQRVVKRVQRRIVKEAGGVDPHDDNAPVAALPAARAYADGGADDTGRRAAAYEEVLEQAKDAPAYKMLVQRIVHRKSAEEIAAMFGISVAAYYKITGRFQERMQRAAIAAGIAGLMLVGVRAYHDDQVAHRAPITVDAGVAYDRAMALAHDARKECDLGEWKQCSELLDSAAIVDPTIRDRESFKALRAAADTALAQQKVVPETAQPTDAGGTGGKAPRGGAGGAKGGH